MWSLSQRTAAELAFGLRSDSAVQSEARPRWREGCWTHYLPLAPQRTEKGVKGGLLTKGHPLAGTAAIAAFGSRHNSYVADPPQGCPHIRSSQMYAWTFGVS